MKICERGLHFFQVTDGNGNVRLCSWTTDGKIGSIIDATYEEVWHGKKANELRKRLIHEDYSKCILDDCPFLSKGEMDEHMVEIEEIPDYPELLSLSFDNTCNYNCSSCDIHERHEAEDKKAMQARMDRIEAEIRKVMPHVKEISANGQGEVFASKRIMKLLSEWKPLAPVSECRASIETNGSLFDEEHWKQIENLGRYHLTVSVTVMSFDEYTYQQLSGVKYPISRIENNLHYIKQLREKGVIDFLELATVVQERNFRQLPEFTRRCIDEFGADEVRLRHFLPWHKKAPEIEWFADVRNPYHPYYQEYREIMEHPIFKHPKVNDWSGGRDSLLGEHPYRKKADLLEKRQDVKRKIMEAFFDDPQGFQEQISEKIPDSVQILIYGIGEIGKLFVRAMQNRYRIIGILDRYSDLSEFAGIAVEDPKNWISDNAGDYAVIITPVGDKENIIKGLIKDGISSEYMLDGNDLILKG